MARDGISSPPLPSPLIVAPFSPSPPPAPPPQEINASYGARSAKARLASKALDASLGAAFDAMSTNAGRRLTSQLIVGQALSEKLAVGGRRLQCGSF